MDKINFTTGAGTDIPNDYNRTRKMTDEQLRQLFEPGDTPTNEDHIAIIDSKVNVDDVYGKEKVDSLFTDHVSVMHKDIPKIDDVNISTGTVYSSSKIENRISNHRHDASQIDNLPQPGGSSDSKDITYDNATSKLKSTNVQGAIDELVVNDATMNGKVEKNTTDIQTVNTSISTLTSNINSVQKHKVTSDDGNAILISNQDINNYKKCGTYMGINVTNAPSTDWWFYEIKSQNENYIVQDAIQFTSANTPRKTRVCLNGVWGVWRSL